MLYNSHTLMINVWSNQEQVIKKLFLLYNHFGRHIILFQKHFNLFFREIKLHCYRSQYIWKIYYTNKLNCLKINFKEAVNFSPNRTVTLVIMYVSLQSA